MPGGRVAQAVVEQVDGQPVQLVRVALDRHRTTIGQGQAVAVGDRAHLGEGRGGDRSEVALAPGAGAPRVGPREQQQVGHQPAHPPRGARGADSIISPSSPRRPAPRAVLEQLQVGEDAGQGGAQLV